MPDDIQNPGTPEGQNVTPTTTVESSPKVETSADIWKGTPDWTKAAGVKTPTETTPTKTETPATATAVPPVTSAAAPSPAMTPEQIAQLAANVVRGMTPQQQAAQPSAPQVDEAELMKQLGIYTPTAEDVEKALGVKLEAGQLTALNHILQSVSRQSVNISQFLTQRALEQFQQSLNPYISTIRNQEAVRQEGLFYDEHKDLKGYQALVQQTFQQAVASGRKFGTDSEARKFVADTTRALLKQIGVAPTAPATPQSTQTTKTAAPNQPRKMTPTALGGREGGTSATKPANQIEAVWGTKG